MFRHIFCFDISKEAFTIRYGSRFCYNFFFPEMEVRISNHLLLYICRNKKISGFPINEDCDFMIT